MRAMKEPMNWLEKALANSPAKNLPNHVVCSITFLIFSITQITTKITQSVFNIRSELW